ncbi:MAG: ABC transporter substrate-binding protein [Proteobacteria bacterium]|nr:ABC transporter substrate-binding protein [Pseudomonadota bacterium]MDA0983776.1 ABC transporter substrate-binding protein [Pseudomonadota bacterium]
MKRILGRLALAALALVGSGAVAQQDRADTLVWATTQVPRHFNQGVQSGVATMMPGAQIFASPLRFGEGWEPLPYLAESWSFQDDGKSLLLKLVSNAKFHDGKPITSEDVAFSIMMAKKHHPFQSMFSPVERVDTPDPRVAIIRLSAPHPAILLALSPAFCPVVPKHIYGDGKDLKTHPANSKPVGSGPYKFVEYKPGEYLILEKFDDFFIPGRPKFKRQIMRIIKDPSALTVAMERGEIDFLPWFGGISETARMQKLPGLQVISKGGQAIGPLNWVAFNQLKKPFNDVRVRKAIAYAIDQDFITKKLHRGLTQQATGPIAPGSPFYTDKVTSYKVDLKRAMKLLDEAGLKPGANGTRFAMTLDYIPGAPDNYLTVAEYLRPQLRKVGIDVTVRAAPDFPTWAKRVSSWDFDASVDASFNYGDPVIGVHRTYLSSNIRKGVIWSNTQNYRSDKADDLMARATVEKDFDKRKALYHEFQKLIVDDVPVAYTHVHLLSMIASKSLRKLPVTIWHTLTPFDEIERAAK